MRHEAEDHVLADQAVGLGLAGDGLHTLTEDDADADAGADGGEAVTDRAEVAGDLGERQTLLFSFSGRPVEMSHRSWVFAVWKVSVRGVQRVIDVHRGEHREHEGLQDWMNISKAVKQRSS